MQPLHQASGTDCRPNAPCARCAAELDRRARPEPPAPRAWPLVLLFLAMFAAGIFLGPRAW